MQVRFVPAATPERIAAAAALADKVWNEHYAGLLAPAQIAYMVDKFQSAGAIARQIAQEGYRYFLLELDGRAAGYTAVQTTGKRLFLSKLYIAFTFYDFFHISVTSFTTVHCIDDPAAVISIQHSKCKTQFSTHLVKCIVFYNSDFLVICL